LLEPVDSAEITGPNYYADVIVESS